ncbi:response regulator [Kribbella sp.]|uniref:response regulator n=1 Tax=Kribbella sp. TaxID=1871183 RepID=UPI002D5A2670|nr:response regulator [Kribbella sp.]HZX05556.1 response regulator [Kribbella sp.]
MIVDDSAGFLEAARRLLERQGLAVLGVASTADEAFRRIVELAPDVALVDLDLGGESGLELAERLEVEAVAVPVVIVSTHSEEDYWDLVATSPAIGFVPKARLSARAVRALLSGAATGPRER